jgi:hypothetical protein
MYDGPLYYNAGVAPRGKSFFRCKVDQRDRLSPILLEPFDAIRAFLRKYRTDDCYVTILGQTDPHVGEGDLYGDFYLDFDDKERPENALNEVRQALDAMLSIIPSSAISVWFSGRKGFHLLVDADALGVEPMSDLNEVYRYLADELRIALDLRSLDMGIYDSVRLFRMPYTYNVEGEAYKIPLSLDEVRLLDLDMIRDLAQSNDARELPPRGHDDYTVLQAWFAEQVAACRAQAVPSAHYTDREIQRHPSGQLPPCVENLLAEVLRDGDGRNRALWVLGTYWHEQGADDTELMDRLSATNQQYEPPLSTRELAGILKNISTNPKRVGCRTPELSSHCPGRRQCWYFLRAKPPEEMVEQGFVVTDDTDEGFTATCDGWSYLVDQVRAHGAKLMARIKTTGPQGASLYSVINLMAESNRANYTKGLAKEDRDIIYGHLRYLAEYADSYAGRGQKQVESGVATEQRRIERVREADGYYEAKRVDRDGTMRWEPISNFTIRVKRLLYEYDPTGDMSCVREIVLVSRHGAASRPKRCYKGDLATVHQFTAWCNGAGEFSFTGLQNDLSEMKEKYIIGAAAEDEATSLDHIGHVQWEPGLFLFGNVGVYRGDVVHARGDGCFSVAGNNFQIRGIDLRTLVDTIDQLPQANTDYLQNPEGLRDLKRRILDLLRESLLDYRGWLALGVVYAGLYLPEITAKYRQFPGVNLFGVMGSGKNTLLRWMQGALGMPATWAYELNATTLSALSRTMSYLSGYPLIMDEFRNTRTMEPKLHQMRNWYDRQGRAIAAIHTTSQTVSLPVRGWMVVAGQDRTTDTALNSRFVTLVMANRNRSTDQQLKQEIDRLMAAESSAIALDVLVKKTPETTASMISAIDKGQRYLMDVTSGNGFERMAWNYGVALAGWHLAFGDVATDEQKRSFIDWTAQQAERRSQEQSQTTEAMTFLTDLSVLVAREYIVEGINFKREQNATIRTSVTHNEDRLFHDVLYLWLPSVYDAWETWKGHKRVDGLWSYDAIRNALEGEKCYLGEVVKQFGHVQHRAVVLDLNELPAGLKYELTT